MFFLPSSLVFETQCQSPCGFRTGRCVSSREVLASRQSDPRRWGYRRIPRASREITPVCSIGLKMHRLCPCSEADVNSKYISSARFS
uniref:Uncharacterized protein n=1 Tax=Physcomitrium patens TaxID=3218 RepID=A0A2K1ILR5_PHYPA|nr:hypothetical protein PHYPA_026532 [Physcomitrium patens]